MNSTMFPAPMQALLLSPAALGFYSAFKE